MMNLLKDFKNTWEKFVNKLSNKNDSTPFIEGLTKFRNVSGKETITMILCAMVIGIGCGVLAVCLNWGVHNLGILIRHTPHGIWQILFPGVGAGIAVFISKKLFNDRDAHGVPSIIKSVSLGSGVLPRRMIGSRFLGSLFTVGSGGSAGLEGPILCIGGAWGSLISQKLILNQRQKKMLIGYGVAGAISGIFNAPLTGIFFTLEIVMGEWTYLTILPTIISATAATEISRLIMGNKITFFHEIASFSLTSMIACFALGILTGLVSVTFARTLTWWEIIFQKITKNPYLKAAIGGLTVGTMGYFFPEVLFEGYSTTQEFLTGSVPPTLGFVFGFIILKMIASGITLGSGGVGGVFAPSLVIGSAVGLAFGLFLHLLPLDNLAESSAFSLVGMAGMVTGVMHGPLTGIFLVMEVTGGYSLILPLMLTATSSMLISFFIDIGSVYTRELIRRGDLVKRGSDAYVLHHLNIRDIIDLDFTTVPEGLLLGDFLPYFNRAKRNYFPVLDDAGNCMGIVILDDVRPYLFNYYLHDIVTMGSIMKMIPTIECDQPISNVIGKFEEASEWALPVVENGKYLGMLSKSSLFDHYRREVQITN